MDIIRVSILGIAGVFLGFLLKGTKPEYAYLLTFGTGICILVAGVGKLEYLFASIEKLRSYIPVESVYLVSLLKMIGITYIGQFSAGICKDAGYSAIAGQIELFSKLAIMAVSMPVRLALLETIQEFLS